MDRHPVRPECTADGPLTCVQPDSHPSDTEHFPTDVVTMADSLGSTEDVLPDTQCGEPPDVPDDTEETTDTCTSEAQENEQASFIRRSTRMRDQPDRLQYVELGNPLLAMMQSFFNGLTTVLDTAMMKINLMKLFFYLDNGLFYPA